MQIRLASARSEVRAWLDETDPGLQFGPTANDATPRADQQLVEAFLHRVLPLGFAFAVQPFPTTEAFAFDVHWTYRGSSFVGFSQPPSASDVVEAQVLACAALLRNDWCRQRLG